MLDFSTVMTIVMQFALLLSMLSTMNTQATERPAVPDAIKAPAGESVIVNVHASGSQIYVCQASADGKFAWTLKAPDADLSDDQGNVVGHHSAGPAWKYRDGSEVTGKAAARVDAPTPDSIPWLLVSATGHTGEGMFSHITSIQRINTKGGQPPAASTCDTAKLNSESKSSYTADYYFFAPKN